MNDITKKGYMAEHFVAADLISLNYVPCIPTVPTTEFDIIAVKGNRKIKIQVKSGEFKGNRLKVDLRKSKAKHRKYSSDDIDIYAVFDRESSEIAYLSILEYEGFSSASLYKTPPEKVSGLPAEYQAKIFGECSLKNALDYQEQAS